MPEFFLHIRTNDKGEQVGVKALTRSKMIDELLQPAGLRRVGYVPNPDEPEGVQLVKHALDVIGGARQLAFKMNVSRVAIYNWVKRGGPPNWHYAALNDIIKAYGPKPTFNVDEYEDDGEPIHGFDV